MRGCEPHERQRASPDEVDRVETAPLEVVDKIPRIAEGHDVLAGRGRTSPRQAHRPDDDSNRGHSIIPFVTAHSGR